MHSRYGNCITEEVTEIPRCCSRRIQSEVAWRAALRPLTAPAIWMAPPNSSSFSVRVVLPASGCEMIAKVRRRPISAARPLMGQGTSGRRGLQGGEGEVEPIGTNPLAAFPEDRLQLVGQVSAVLEQKLDRRFRHDGSQR